VLFSPVRIMHSREHLDILHHVSSVALSNLEVNVQMKDSCGKFSEYDFAHMFRLLVACGCTCEVSVVQWEFVRQAVAIYHCHSLGGWAHS
jgi:hypothetical protein